MLRVEVAVGDVVTPGDALAILESMKIDTIEAAIVSTLMPFEGNPVGYAVAERVAADQPEVGGQSWQTP